jgi:hypothetical protein
MTILSRRGVLPTLVFLGSLALYAGTMLRTPGWLDDTLILSLAHTGEVNSWVNNHNLFNLLGHYWLQAWAFIEPHTALTFLCALFAGAAVLFAYHAGREVTGSPAAAALAAAALAVSHSLWWHATVVEVYSLNAALIALQLFLAARYFRTRSFPCMFAAFVLFGIGVFNHVLMGLFVAAFGTLFVMLLAGREHIGWRKGLLLVAATALGTVPYLVVFVRDVLPMIPGRGLPAAVGAVLDSATGSYFRASMFPRNISGSEQVFWRLNYLFLLWYNFPAAALPLAAWGTVRLRRAEHPLPLAVFFWVGLAAQVTWSSNYLIWDMYAFSMPVYVLASLPLAVGLQALMLRARPALKTAALVSLFLPAALYPMVSSVPGLAELGRRYIALYRSSAVGGLEQDLAAQDAGLLGRLTARVWDPVRYILNPARAGYREVAEFCGGVLKQLPQGSQYWDDDSKGGYPLHYYYQGMRGERPDVRVHLLILAHLDADAAAAEVNTMRSAIQGAGEFFIATVEWPERELLIRLSLAMSPAGDPLSLRQMETRRFLDAVPGLSITAVPLGTRPGLAIYRVARR